MSSMTFSLLHGQIAQDDVKPEFFRFTVTGSALKFYKSIEATNLDCHTVQYEIKVQLTSTTKTTKIGVALDIFHIDVEDV